MEQLKEVEQEVDNNTSGEITSINGRTVAYQSVQVGQETKRVGDPLHPTFILEMVPN